MKDLVLAMFLGMTLMIPLFAGLASYQASDLETKHKADKRAAVHFATLGHAEDMKYCRQTVVGCTWIVDHCLAALGRDSSEPEHIPIELESL